jgi:hypothetical protein
MRSDDGAVDHLQHVQCAAAVSQRLKQKIPDARLGSATELLPHGVPFAERRRQLVPRRSGPADPEYAVQSVPMVPGWTPATREGHSQQGREDRPLFVGHQSADLSRASSLPRGRSRLTASRSIESPDARKTRNKSRDGGHDSF